MAHDRSAVFIHGCKLDGLVYSEDRHIAHVGRCHIPVLSPAIFLLSVLLSGLGAVM